MEEIEKKEARENFSEEVFIETRSPKRRKITTYIIAMIVVGLIFSGKVIMSSQSNSDWLSEKGFFNKIKHLVPSADKKLKGEENDRINIILLGMGGEGHDGPYLADTIMLASLKPSTKQVALVSIPRDLTVPIDGVGWRKVNHVNALAEAKEKGSGGPATMATLSSLLQIPIHYYIRVDFAGFEKIIDEIGGIDVYVENTLSDYAYPIFGQEDNPNYYARFEHLYIEKGWQKMDGALALKYSRSRHGSGIEGSDFARAKRQQLVLEAVKNKLLSRQTLLNPVTVGKLINEFNRNLSTNFDVWEMIKLWNMFKETKKENIINQVLSDAPKGFLVSSISPEGAYILVPSSGNFSAIRNMVRDVFGEDQDSDSSPPTAAKPVPTIRQEASVAVKNGTWITGLANKNATNLKTSGFIITETSNAPNRENSLTFVYDLTYGNKNEELAAIKKITGAQQSFDFPEWIKEYQDTPGAADFVLILGTDANKAE